MAFLRQYYRSCVWLALAILFRPNSIWKIVFETFQVLKPFSFSLFAMNFCVALLHVCSAIFFHLVIEQSNAPLLCWFENFMFILVRFLLKLSPLYLLCSSYTDCLFWFNFGWIFKRNQFVIVKAYLFSASHIGYCVTCCLKPLIQKSMAGLVCVCVCVWLYVGRGRNNPIHIQNTH